MTRRRSGPGRRDLVQVKLARRAELRVPARRGPLQPGDANVLHAVRDAPSNASTHEKSRLTESEQGQARCSVDGIRNYRASLLVLSITTWQAQCVCDRAGFLFTGGRRRFHRDSKSWEPVAAIRSARASSFNGRSKWAGSSSACTPASVLAAPIKLT